MDSIEEFKIKFSQWCAEYWEEVCKLTNTPEEAIAEYVNNLNKIVSFSDFTPKDPDEELLRKTFSELEELVGKNNG